MVLLGARRAKSGRATLIPAERVRLETVPLRIFIGNVTFPSVRHSAFTLTMNWYVFFLTSVPPLDVTESVSVFPAREWLMVGTGAPGKAADVVAETKVKPSGKSTVTLAWGRSLSSGANWMKSVRSSSSVTMVAASNFG